MIIEVIYALPTKQTLIKLEMPEGSRVKDAIKLSKIKQEYPDLEITEKNLGIWYKPATPESLLRDMDRVEIYRPLIVDPKQARKNRVRKKAK